MHLVFALTASALTATALVPASPALVPAVKELAALASAEVWESVADTAAAFWETSAAA